MFSENIGNDYIVIQEGTSEGTQVKYKKDGYWYKKDNRGNEGRAEYLVSKFMQFTTLQENEFISYEEGTINGKSGCRSKNFLDEEEELVTFYRLYYNEVGKDLSKVIANMNTMEERIEYVIRFIDQSCGLNIHAYLSKVLTLDMICLNEDRHLNNLALIMRGNDFYPAPIFDNGVSLLTANQSVNWNFSIEENVKRVIARPFCGSHEKMVKYLESGFSIDVKSALSWLETEPDSIERNVLRYQIDRYNKRSKSQCISLQYSRNSKGKWIKSFSVFGISAVSGEGVNDLLYYLYDVIRKTDRTPKIFEKEFEIEYVGDRSLPYTVEKDEEGIYVVEGPRIEKMLGYTNLDSEKGFDFFQKFLKQSGILADLEKAGIQEGDTVRMYGLVFDYYK